MQREYAAWVGRGYTVRGVSAFKPSAAGLVWVGAAQGRTRGEQTENSDEDSAELYVQRIR
jgi:hypothetical protein